MDEIDQYFKEHLENLPLEGYDPRAWEALKPRLRKTQAKHHRYWKLLRYLTIAVLGLLLGLILGNVNTQQRGLDRLLPPFVHNSGPKNLAVDYLAKNPIDSSSPKHGLVSKKYKSANFNFPNNQSGRGTLIKHPPKNDTKAIDPLKLRDAYLSLSTKSSFFLEKVILVPPQKPNSSPHFSLELGTGWLAARDKSLKTNAVYGGSADIHAECAVLKKEQSSKKRPFY